MRDEEIAEIEKRIGDSPNPYAAVGEFAVKIVFRDSANGDETGLEQKHCFTKLVSDNALEDAAEWQANYLLRLMSQGKNLLFEEVALVFSLLEELEAYERLGLALPEALASKVRSSFGEWVAADSRRIQVIVRSLAGGDRVCHLWFYRQVFPSS